MDTGKDVTKGQEDVRQRFTIALITAGCTLHAAAKQMGVSRSTLTKFINGTEVSVMPFIKIQNWVNEKVIHARG